jgi:hypothetical protein
LFYKGVLPYKYERLSFSYPHISLASQADHTMEKYWPVNLRRFLRRLGLCFDRNNLISHPLRADHHRLSLLDAAQIFSTLTPLMSDHKGCDIMNDF